MNRQDAITLAKSIVEDWSKVQTNDRGYPRDGWKPPTLGEQTQAIVHIAEFLVRPEPHLVRPETREENACSVEHILGQCPGPPECM